MTPLFGFRQRAEDFAARVDGHVQGPGRTSSEVQAPADPDQERLLAVVSGLRRQPGLAAASAPRPAFAASLREALVAEAATALVAGPSEAATPVRRPVRAAGPRRVVAAATVAVLVSGSAGMAAAAEGSLPGETLYPVKRGIEKAEVRLSRTAAGRGHDLLSQAATRLTEVEGLLAVGGVTAEIHVPPTLTTFTWQAKEGAAELMRAYEETNDPDTIAEVRTFAASSIETLESISTSGIIPDAADPALLKAAYKVRSVDRAATEECDDCVDLPDVEVSDVLLASTSGDEETDGDGLALAEGGLLAPLLGGLAPVDPLAPLDPRTDEQVAGGPPDGSVEEPLAGDALGGGTDPAPGSQATQTTEPAPGGDGVVEGDGDIAPDAPAEAPAATDPPSGEPTEGTSQQPSIEPSPNPEPTDPSTDSSPDTDPDPGTDPGPSPSEPDTGEPDTGEPDTSVPPSSETPSTDAPADTTTIPAEGTRPADGTGAGGGEGVDEVTSEASSVTEAARGAGKARGPKKAPGPRSTG